ncbi:MAG: transposase, partial [Lachnospiraceae bacterium]
MRLGYSKSKNSIFYYVQKTIYVEGKNKSVIIKRLGSEKYICETYCVTDAKAWAKEEVRKMNVAEKEETPIFDIPLCAGTDLILDEQMCFNGGYLFLQQ